MLNGTNRSVHSTFKTHMYCCCCCCCWMLHNIYVDVHCPRICNVFILVCGTDFRVLFFTIPASFSASKFIHVWKAKNKKQQTITALTQTHTHTHTPNSTHQHLSIFSEFLFYLFARLFSFSVPLTTYCGVIIRKNTGSCLHSYKRFQCHLALVDKISIFFIAEQRCYRLISGMNSTR